MTQFTLNALNRYLEEAVPTMVEKALVERLPGLGRQVLLQYFTEHSDKLLMPLLTEYFTSHSIDFAAVLAEQLEPVIQLSVKQHSKEILKALTPPRLDVHEKR
ncbi:MAG: hypothetical protein Q7T25_09765 [Sideroxyarcus sp.]|nr:hypothetical protein [Sideroxyarcus sp.]